MVKRVRYRGLTYEVPGRIMFRGKQYLLQKTGTPVEMYAFVRKLRSGGFLVNPRDIKSTRHIPGICKLPAVYARSKK